MTIRLMGTGAAEGIPAFYSDSYVSRYAREHGGKDVRTRSAALIDGCIKIDLPPDTLMQMNRDELDARDWTALIFTHSHDDHFSPAELQYGLYPFNEMEHMGFAIFGNESICDKIREMYPNWPMEVHATHAFEPFEHQNYTITPVLATHSEDEEAQNLMFEHDGAALLYATDTGVWPEPTWEFLKAKKLDLLVIECTEGKRESDYEGHLNARKCIEVVERLRKQGTLGPGSQVCTTHHSHNGGATHAELEAILNPHQIDVGYDGLVICVLRSSNC